MNTQPVLCITLFVQRCILRVMHLGGRIWPTDGV